MAPFHMDTANGKVVVCLPPLTYLQGLGFMYSLGIGVNASQAKVSHSMLKLAQLPTLLDAASAQFTCTSLY